MLISGTLEGRMGTLSLDKQEKLEKDAVKAEKKAEKKAEAEQKKKEVSLTRLAPLSRSMLIILGCKGIVLPLAN
jgi:hypothetical protein